MRLQRQQIALICKIVNSFSCNVNGTQRCSVPATVMWKLVSLATCVGPHHLRRLIHSFICSKRRQTGMRCSTIPIISRVNSSSCNFKSHRIDKSAKERTIFLGISLSLDILTRCKRDEVSIGLISESSNSFRNSCSFDGSITLSEEQLAKLRDGKQDNPLGLMDARNNRVPDRARNPFARCIGHRVKTRDVARLHLVRVRTAGVGTRVVTRA